MEMGKGVMMMRVEKGPREQIERYDKSVLDIKD